MTPRAIDYVLNQKIWYYVTPIHIESICRRNDKSVKHVRTIIVVELLMLW